MVNGKKDRTLTTGSIALGLLWFAVPMILGNLLQQFYNIADTLIVGQFLGAKALAAVGSAYTLMVFLTSVLLGLCMGSGAIFSLQYGAGDREALKRSTFVSLVLIGFVTYILFRISAFSKNSFKSLSFLLIVKLNLFKICSIYTLSVLKKLLTLL